METLFSPSVALPWTDGISKNFGVTKANTSKKKKKAFPCSSRSLVAPLPLPSFGLSPALLSVLSPGRAFRLHSRIYNRSDAPGVGKASIHHISLGSPPLAGSPHHFSGAFGARKQRRVKASLQGKVASLLALAREAETWDSAPSLRPGPWHSGWLPWHSVGFLPLWSHRSTEDGSSEALGLPQG